MHFLLGNISWCAGCKKKYLRHLMMYVFNMKNGARLHFLILHHHQRSLAMHITMRVYSASTQDGFCLYQTSNLASQTAIFSFMWGRENRVWCHSISWVLQSPDFGDFLIHTEQLYKFVNMLLAATLQTCECEYRSLENFCLTLFRCKKFSRKKFSWIAIPTKII